MRKMFSLVMLSLMCGVAVPLQAAAPLHPVHAAAPPKPPALHAAPAAKPPASAICLDPNEEYDADYLSGRAVLIKAKAGKKPHTELKADTNCIGIDGSVHIKLDAKGDCIVVGDSLKLRRNGDFGWQTCQITQITPVTNAK
jgi:hypothetical protein